MYIARPIRAEDAKYMVTRYHYSGKVVSNSQIHLGVFKDDTDLVGVLQYGPPMNGLKTAKKLCADERMMELNRMVMHPDEPRNSESMAIAACNKWLRANTDLQWLLSFSDGKQGNVGYIYQATNWKYLGYALSDSFYDLDGAIVHSVSVWHRYKEKHPIRLEKTTNQIMCLHHKDVSRITSKQHIYVMPLRKKVKFEHPGTDYPKKDREQPILTRVWIQREGVACTEREDYDPGPFNPVL